MKTNSTSLIVKAFLGILFVLPVVAFPQQFGNVLEFDGLDDYVLIGNDTSLQVDHFTLTAWVHPYSYSDPIPNEQRMEIFEKAGEYWMNISTNGGYQRDKGELRVGGFFEGQWHFLDSESIIPLNEWTHVACIYDSDSLVIYINGKYNTAKAIPENHTDKLDKDNMLAIGCKSINGVAEEIEAQFHGMLDELSIWNTDLSQSQLVEVMQHGIEKNHPLRHALRAYYKLDENKIGEFTGIVKDDTGINDGMNFGAEWVENLLKVNSSIFSWGVKVYPSYPNPFHDIMYIPIALDKSSFVQIDIYSENGQHIKSLVKKQFSQGKHTIKWDANGLSTGSYYCKVKVEGYSKVIRCVLIN